MANAINTYSKGLPFEFSFLSFLSISFSKMYSTLKIMNIYCLNVGSKVRLKLGATRNTLTVPKAYPEPYTYIVLLHSFLINITYTT